jgi:hypothetical protein
MATPQRPPKSILKKSTSYPSATGSQADRNREIALYHARLLQERKDIELEILFSTEALIDYPLAKSSPAITYDASSPSPADARSFKEMLRPFQPSDYDALILERNLDNRCGYTLCSNPRPRDGKGGQWRLIGMGGKAKDFRIAKREDVEKWCSEACARRALYVRVQLSETPAWERGASTAVPNIDLLDEPKSDEDMVMDGIENLDLNKQEAQNREREASNLALERGESSQGSGKNVANFTIKEKDVRGTNVKPPTLEPNELSDRMDTLHLNLEGHTSTFDSRQLFGEEDEEMDTDWKM